jgi:glycosyltransferase involved in cell wall biosynthesis
MLSSWIMKVPTRIYFRHGIVYETMKGRKRKMMIFFDKLTSFCSTKIVAVSQSVLKQSIEDKLAPETKHIILGKGTCGGIDALNKFNKNLINHSDVSKLGKKLGLKSSDLVIGYCGRLVKDKGIIELVEAFLKLKEYYSNIKLLLVGDFEERDALPQKIIDLINNNQDIVNTGFIFDKVEYYYNLMNIYVLASYREGFPISILEASAMELPVLTTRVTGCIDSILDGQTGYFIDNTSESIVHGINRILKNDNSSQLGKNGRKFILENFDQQILWPIIESKLYS